MGTAHSARFRLSIPADKYLAYYQGAAKNVVVSAETGVKLQFPANAIRRFLKHEGIYGLFEIQFDEDNKLIGIERLAD